jgi:hypothetical protein
MKKIQVPYKSVIEGKRYTNIGGCWAATIFSVKFHFFFYSVQLILNVSKEE